MELACVKSYTQETQSAIDRAEQTLNQLTVHVPSSLGSDDKEALLTAFNSVILEHFRAICMLCDSQAAIGSALALFRPLVDAVLRSEWLYLCATSEQVNRFMKNDYNLGSLGFGRMATAVDEAVDVGKRLEDFAGCYQGMCDYTHTGHNAVFHRVAANGGVEPTYSEKKIRILVTVSAQIVVRHFIVCCNVIHKSSLAKLNELAILVNEEPNAL